MNRHNNSTLHRHGSALHNHPVCTVTINIFIIHDFPPSRNTQSLLGFANKKNQREVILRFYITFAFMSDI